jgi:hypothetical protein
METAAREVVSPWLVTNGGIHFAPSAQALCQAITLPRFFLAHVQHFLWDCEVVVFEKGRFCGLF